MTLTRFVQIEKNESTICNEAYDIDDFHLTYIQFFEKQSNTYLNHLSQTPPFNNISTTKLYFLKAPQKQFTIKTNTLVKTLS